VIVEDEIRGVFQNLKTFYCEELCQCGLESLVAGN